MLFETVGKEYVLNAISRLKKGKASGPDKVTITFVKDAAISIAYPLILIYNASLMNGIFPDIWKLARPSLRGSPIFTNQALKLIQKITGPYLQFLCFRGCWNGTAYARAAV